jgi:calcineurin-like phosphoesterase family protein
MNIKLIENWNNTVKPDDEIHNLGDFAFGNNVEYYLSLLNGHITNIRGNHDRNKICKSWVQRMDFEYGGYKFLLNHRPVFEQCDKDSERFGNINLSEYDYILCGHIHEKWKVNQKNINVGVDVWDYKPVSIDTIIELIKSMENTK